MVNKKICLILCIFLLVLVSCEINVTSNRDQIYKIDADTENLKFPVYYYDNNCTITNSYIEEESNTLELNIPDIFIKDGNEYKFKSMYNVSLYNTSENIVFPDSMDYLSAQIIRPTKKIILPNDIKYIDLEIRPNVVEDIEFNIYKSGKYLGSKTNPYLYYYGPCDDANKIAIHKNCKFVELGNIKSNHILSVILNNNVISVKGFNEVKDKIKYKEDDGCYYLGSSSNKYYALVSCSDNVSNVNINYRCVVVGELAFKDKMLESLLINDNLKYIDAGAFYNVNGLKEIKLNDDLLFIGEKAFAISKIEKINLPKNIDSVYSIFEHAENLKEVNIEGELKYIYGGSFVETQIESFDFSSICGIFGNAFATSKLKSADLSFVNFNTIPYGAFQSCEDLTNVILNDNIKIIEDFAFSQTNIKEIDLSSVKQLGMTSFGFLGDLNIIYKGGETAFNTNVKNTSDAFYQTNIVIKDKE